MLLQREVRTFELYLRIISKMAVSFEHIRLVTLQAKAHNGIYQSAVPAWSWDECKDLGSSAGCSQC